MITAYHFTHCDNQEREYYAIIPYIVFIVLISATAVLGVWAIKKKNEKA